MKRWLQLILTILFITIMTIPSLASELHVYDAAGLLEAEELIELDEKAAAVSEKYECGVYVIAVNDYLDYSSSDPYTAATEMYHGLGLGEGENRDGILLMLSMSERDYATFFYGDTAAYAFNEYGQIEMEKVFLDDFSENYWYGGFYDYISVCDEYLGLAAAGKPVRDSFTDLFLIVIAVSVLISLVVGKVLKSSMKSVSKGSAAAVYATQEGLVLTERIDQFLYNTQTRRRIERSKDTSSSHSGGGGSGRSGKF